MSNKNKRGLEAYRKKRSAGGTAEPFGDRAGDRPRLFCVQKHAASRLHYDFRLEWNGVLLSWAVPRGPCLDPSVKRMAVHVEDHPVDYADFEGIIPKGNYGAGEVILWDRGRWTPIEDPDAGLAKGKLLFDLDGYKLGGRWTLVRTKREGKEGNEWLLIKKPDAWADPEAELPETSVLSGRTVEELAEGARAGQLVKAALKKAKVPEAEVDFAEVRPMLCEPEDRPPKGAGYLHEVKLDGFRLMVARRKGQPRLYYRRGMDATALYPDLAVAVAALPYDDLLLDGELVVYGPGKRPSFQALQQRAQLSKKSDIERAAVERPAIFFAFDLLAFEGHDLRRMPLVERKALLRELVPDVGPVRYSEHYDDGEALYQQVTELGLEGVVSKRKDSRYVSRRSDAWQKIRVDRTADLVVVGFSRPKGERTGLGALHLAYADEGTFRYAGRVGSGFAEADLKALAEGLEAIAVDEAPCEGAPTGTRHVWVEPRLVAEVRFKEWTDAGHLRHPVFLRLRDDKLPEECPRPGAPPAEAPPPPDVVVSDDRAVRYTNLDKVFWPETGLTKGDLVDWYTAIAELALPYLADRPVVLTRYPDGIEGKSFFQKDAPEWTPEWVRTERVYSESGEKEIDYFIAADKDHLGYLANLGAIVLHLWSARASRPQRPDWFILDLDPKEAPFEDVLKLARSIHRVCEAIGLPSFPKTSGSTGLHVLVPTGGQLTHDQATAMAELLARVVVREHEDIATVVRNPKRREGKVYIDFLQNGYGRLLVAPYSVRPLPGAPVSMPLRWSEVKKGLTPGRFTVQNGIARVKRWKGDPLAGVLDEVPDLAGALGRLAEWFEGG